MLDYNSLAVQAKNKKFRPVRLLDCLKQSSLVSNPLGQKENIKEIIQVSTICILAKRKLII